MATLTGQNPKVFLIDKETGEKREIHGVISTTNIHEMIDEDLKAKLNIPKGPYSWTVKTRFSRRMRKQFRRMFWTPREAKYIKKSTLAGWILKYDVTNIKTEDELMKLSHRELTKRITPVVAMTVVADEIRRRCGETLRHDFPCGGIVPSQDIRPNTGEMIICPPKAQKMRVELMPDLAKIEKPSIDIFEIVRKASERRGLEIPEILPDNEEIKFEHIKLDDQNPN